MSSTTKKSARRVPPAGEVRQSQMITTSGPGAMMDLPDHAVMISGLERWKQPNRQRIHEPRLQQWLEQELGISELKFYAPPINEEDTAHPSCGVAAFLFPLWFLAQVDQTIVVQGKTYRTRPFVHFNHLNKGKYEDEHRKLHKVVPVRFVRACVRGHITDINWIAFMRQGARDFRGELWFDEGGSGNDFSEIYVREARSGKRRPLSDAMVHQGRSLGTCGGHMPWLGEGYREECDKPYRLLTRSASNAYFPRVVSAISIPRQHEELVKAVDDLWENHLQYAEDEQDVVRELRRDHVARRLEGYAVADIWREVSARREGAPDESEGLKRAELRTLRAQERGFGEDRPEGDFFARLHVIEGMDEQVAGRLESVVLVHRLREVLAQVGFTRFEPAQTGFDGELDLEVEHAPLSHDDLGWLPAVENRGEGIFFELRREAMEAWLDRPGVKAHGEQLERGFEMWRTRGGKKGELEFPGLPYIMLHTLSHMLITELALECGYSSSAIKERIYADEEEGYGVLLYTGSAGSEGTLGGLVEQGKRLDMWIVQALERGELCSNDPICAHHDPTDSHEERFLHGAACHGCVLVAETSCERRNQYLDRALVVPGVMGHEGIAFFERASS